ncbi:MULTISPECIES: hypothetical protein [unclassified Paenibacillus]|uniref:WxL domain-containing protein n=1 Tax=Paenibacillus provencensis TaxID=441151 RepID=A0ABW3Q0G8_9BACL|nr:MULTISPECIES: hypothetical protein [unclassified Paenibacillus]MCM3130225.1 hypothetical protein [Paenibacillus sp. MER 78]SDX72045.1 hypothetical protein SAMN05518848_112116 [Paenibacillus sp. PDC88]SFS89080.1 hypothetical protein SAMN04488601_106112 [Paenibacillus sp. 453mf]
MSKTKKFGASLLGLALLVSVPLSAAAEEVGQSTESQFSLVGGQLTFSADPIIFAPKVINSNEWKGATVSSKIYLTDDTGRGDGWTLTLSAEDFYSQPLTDPSSGGNGTYVLSYPASSVEVRSGEVLVSIGQEVDPTHGPLSSSFHLSSTPQTIFSAHPGFGMGDYEVIPTFWINTPKTVTVSQLNGEGSSYQVGDTIGAVATTYTSKLTYTLANGI